MQLHAAALVYSAVAEHTKSRLFVSETSTPYCARSLILVYYKERICMATSPEQTAIVQLVKESSKEFVASLSVDEQELFHATKTAQAILQEVSAANGEHKDASVTRRVGAALQPFIAGVEQYGVAIDVFANSSDLLCPIWGSIRIVLHVRNPLKPAELITTRRRFC